MYELQLREKREALGTAWEAYKEFRDSLSTDQDDWSAEDREKFNKLDMDVDRIEDEIRNLEFVNKDSNREARFSQSQGDYFGVNGDLGSERSSRERDSFDFRSNPAGTTERHIFNRYLLDGDRAITPEEFRTMQSGADVAGGFLNAPQKFVNKLIQELENEVHIRKFATKYEIPHNTSLGAPYLESDFDDADWTTELGTGSEDDLSFGKRELRPSPIAKRVKVSRKLLRTAMLNPETLVGQKMAYKFAVTEEKAYMIGDGHNKPLGLFVASDDGIPTSRDVSTDNTATLIKADNLISVQGTLKEQYQKKARWIFHRDAITQIRKLKDGEGQYIWQPGLSTGAGNQILGSPYMTSEYCPNTFTTGQYVGIYGDLSFYWIATCLQMDVQRLVELYAEQNIVGYIGRMEIDAMPVMPSAFVRIKLG